MKGIFNSIFFENKWQLDANCYQTIPQENYLSRNSVMFPDTRNKMQAASENLIKDFFRFDDSMRKREEFHLANKEDMKKDYMSFLENIISALNIGLVDNTRYGQGLESLKTILDRYPEEKDEIIRIALPFLKQGGNRLKSAKSKIERASLAHGMVDFAESISSAEPDLTKVVLPIFSQKSIQDGLSLDVSESDIKRAEYTADSSFKPEYFLKNWQIDEECYTSWSIDKQEWEHIQFPYSNHKSIDIFQDTKNKMQTVVDDILIGSSKFYENTYEDMANKEISSKEAKKQYLAYFDDVVAALNTDLATGEAYGFFGLGYLSAMLKEYPGEDKVLTKTIPFLKKAYKKLEKTENANDKAFMANGIIELVGSISDAQPDLTEFVLPYLKSEKVQEALKINPNEEDDKIDGVVDGYMSQNHNFSKVCNILENMLERDNSLLTEIKDISTAYADCMRYDNLQKEIQKVEQRTIILNSKYKTK